MYVYLKKIFLLTKQENVFPIVNSLSYPKEEKLYGFHWLGSLSMSDEGKAQKEVVWSYHWYKVSESPGVVFNFKIVLPM